MRNLLVKDYPIILRLTEYGLHLLAAPLVAV